MSGPTIIPSITSLPINVIQIGERLRPAGDATVAALEFVIAEFGFTVPVLVRKLRSGFRLIDGLHRIEAMTRRQAETIPVVVVECTDEEARVLEGSQNLAGAAMSPLDEAMFMAAFGDAYQQLHPETKRGAAGALAKHGLANDIMSFAEVIAEKRSISPRHVQRIAAAARLISKDDADKFREAKRKLTLKDIQDFGKIVDADERAMVALRFATGNANSIAAARRSLAAENAGAQPIVEDKAEVAFKALLSIWNRAPKAAKRRFAGELSSELGQLLADEGQDT